MDSKKKDVEIIEVDGIPCIKLDEPIVEEFTFDFVMIEPIDFTSLQNGKNIYWEKILKELMKFFKGNAY